MQPIDPRHGDPSDRHGDAPIDGPLAGTDLTGTHLTGTDLTGEPDTVQDPDATGLSEAELAVIEQELRAAGAGRPWPDDEALAELWARHGIDPSASYEEQEDRYRALFRDPWFVELDRRRRLQYAVDGVPLARRGSANGSIGAALALGFRNVFDPDRARDEIVAVSERGDGDGDGGLRLDLDPTDPRRTRAVIRRR